MLVCLKMEKCIILHRRFSYNGYHLLKSIRISIHQYYSMMAHQKWAYWRPYCESSTLGERGGLCWLGQYGRTSSGNIFLTRIKSLGASYEPVISTSGSTASRYGISTLFWAGHTGLQLTSIWRMGWTGDIYPSALDARSYSAGWSKWRQSTRHVCRLGDSLSYCWIHEGDGGCQQYTTLAHAEHLRRRLSYAIKIAVDTFRPLVCFTCARSFLRYHYNSHFCN